MDHLKRMGEARYHVRKVLSSHGSRAALLLIRVALGIMFVRSSVPKLVRPYMFLATVYEYELVGPNMGVLVAVLLPCVELVAGVCLLGGVMTGGALVTSTVLGMVFVFAQASALYHGLAISCGCFYASGSDMVSYVTLMRASLVMTVSLLGCFLYVRRMARYNKRLELTCLEPGPDAGPCTLIA